MSRHTMDGDHTSTRLGVATVAALRRAAGTRPRRWLVAGTALVGLFTAVAVAAALPPAELTFATVSDPVQSLMSVLVPLMSCLLVRDLRQAPRAAAVSPTLLAAILFAAVVGVFGVVVCAAALAVAPAADPWQNAATIAAGGVLVQIGAGLVGTGLGMLVRPVSVAFLATIVLPLGLWFVLGVVDVLRPGQAWLTPYATVRNLLSGRMGAVLWAQWLVVLLIWGLGLNVVGAIRLKREQA